MARRADFADPRDYNEAVAEEFRANGGQITGDFAGRPVLLLTTTGARSGAPRMTPLIYTKDGDGYVVTAANGGSPRHPGWYHNLVAEPTVLIEVGRERFAAHASEPTGEERDRLFVQRCTETPNFKTFQEKTDRRIPIIVFTRID